MTGTKGGEKQNKRCITVSGTQRRYLKPRRLDACRKNVKIGV